MSHTHFIYNFGFIEISFLSLTRPVRSGALGEVALEETAARTAKRGRSLTHTYRHSHTHTREARILLTLTYSNIEDKWKLLLFDITYNTIELSVHTYNTAFGRHLIEQRLL